LIVRLVLGTLLVVTALLKMSGGSGEALRSALPFVSPRLYASGVMAEFILGVWLLSGLAPAWSWLCALGFFGLLAVLSFQLGVAGQASCGCLGKVPVSPWWAFAVDVTAIIAIGSSRPARLASQLYNGLPSLLVAIGVVTTICIILNALGVRVASVDCFSRYSIESPAFVENKCEVRMSLCKLTSCLSSL
jgi:hypothetical protein